MKLLWKALGRLYQALVLGGVWLSMMLIAFAAVAVTTDVVMRYFFSLPITWESYISENTLLFILCLTSPYVLQKDRHVTMDYVMLKFSPPVRAMTDCVTSVLSAAVLSPLVWYGVQKAFAAYRDELFRTSGAEWLKDWMVLWVIPFGLGLLLVQFLIRAYGRYRLWKEAAR